MRRSVLSLLPLLALSSLACASSGPETPRAGEQATNLNIQMQRGGENLNLRTTSDVNVVHDTLAGSADDLFSRLPKVYNDLGVPISSLNTEAKALGAVGVRAQGDFAGERISRWLDCGTSITGNIADQRQIYITVLTQVEPLEEVQGTSGVSVHVDGYAIRSGRSGSRTSCGTTGRLERGILSRLQLEGTGGGGG